MLPGRIARHVLRAPRLVVCLTAASIAAPAARAVAFDHQVTQGEVERRVEQGAGDDRRFTSPMIITTTMAAAGPANQRKWVSTSEFDGYVCDGVRLRELRTRVVPKRDHVRVDIGATTYTEPGRDKKVRLEIEILDSEKPIAFATILAIDAEERKLGRGRTMVQVPLERWPAGGPPRLKIALSAVDD
jgi:hypothetical protein